MKKFAFVTCVKLGLSCIEEIYRIGGRLHLLITLNDNKGINKSGRVYLDEFSKTNNIPLLKVDNINDDVVLDVLRKHSIDGLFIIGWSQIAKKRILDFTNKGAIGMHPTLLPKGRGRASIPWAIINGLEQTGVTAFKLNEGVDTGDIVGQKKIKLSSDINATALYEMVNNAHVDLIRDIWKHIESDSLSYCKQDDSLATYWEGRRPSDGEINFNMSCEQVDKLVRATTHPYPGAFYIEDEIKIIIWKGRIVEEELYNNRNYIQLSDGFYEILESSKII